MTSHHQTHTGPGHPFLATPEAIIEEARQGRMFVLVDDEDRENEGDLVIPAQFATPDIVNFMAKFGGGLICLALARDRVDTLGLPRMPASRGSRNDTAFTVSIEARTGITTGISAADRARTIAVAIDAASGARDIVSPGHVFPLVARDGGILARPGHTEAAVDVARLAGLDPSGVICEIMNEDGRMARLPDLIEFCRRHDLRLGTIRDLIAYRRRHDHQLARLSERQIRSRSGAAWQAVTFRDVVSAEHRLVLIRGPIDPARPVVVCVHRVDYLSDAIGLPDGRSLSLQSAMEAIEDEGAGVVAFVGGSNADLLSDNAAPATGLPGGDAASGHLADVDAAADVLSALGLGRIVALTSRADAMIGTVGYGLEIVDIWRGSDEASTPGGPSPRWLAATLTPVHRNGLAALPVE